MPPNRRILLIILTLVCCVGCDRQTKSLATTHLRGREPISFLADTLRLEYAENNGAFLSLGDSLPSSGRTALFTYGCSVGVAALLVITFLSRLSDPFWFQALAASLGRASRGVLCMSEGLPLYDIPTITS